MARVIDLRQHRPCIVADADDECTQGATPCRCGRGALTEADLDRRVSERLAPRMHPRIPRTRVAAGAPVTLEPPAPAPSRAVGLARNLIGLIVSAVLLASCWQAVGVATELLQ